MADDSPDDATNDVPDTADTLPDSTSDDGKVVRGIRFVPAEPQVIFDLLADPAQHATIDGSGSVRGSKESSPARLELGAKFGMSMKLGVPYTMSNTVVEFDEPTLIGWTHVGGHIWRYRLRPVEGGTEVTEEFDMRPVKGAFLLKATGAPKRNAKAIEATLDRLAEHFQSGGA